MKAAYITQTGPPEVIQYGELPDPKPGPTQVLVKIAPSAEPDRHIHSQRCRRDAAQVSPTSSAATWRGRWRAVEEEVVQAGRPRLGDRPGTCRPAGSFAELAAVDERRLYPTPAGQSDAEAAAGAVVGIMAHLGVFCTRGSSRGRHFWSTGGPAESGRPSCSSPSGPSSHRHRRLREKKKRASRGADRVLDYHSPTLDEEMRKFAEPAGGIDVWFETAASRRWNEPSR